VSKIKTNKYFVSILVLEKVPFKTRTGKSVGLDLGLTSFIHTSDNEIVEALRSFRKSQAKLAAAQQHLSRKKEANKKLGIKNSRRYQKQRIKVAKVHEKITNQREYFLQVLSTRLVSEYDTVCIENLAVSNMIKNKKLAKSISDASWSSFVSMLEYKCQWYGKELVPVDRFFASSKTCNTCGHVKEDLSLSERTWTCQSCGSVLDRDLNAARNILAEGLRLLGEQKGQPDKLRLSESNTDVERLLISDANTLQGYKGGDRDNLVETLNRESL
jgi:putative transposase